jgi:transaldolase
MTNVLQSLRIKIYADGADYQSILRLNANPLIKGMTTNPSLMYKAGIRDYEGFAREVLREVTTKPISFEVLSDEFEQMRREALKIAGWQKNVFVKIPITNTRGESSIPLIRELSRIGVKLNVTAILSIDDVAEVATALDPAAESLVSVFAGRIADTGRDPMPIMHQSLALLSTLKKTELLWASVREVFNILQADHCGCHIVTIPHDILHKCQSVLGSDLKALSLETVKMFARDAAASGLTLECGVPQTITQNLAPARVGI